MDEFSESFCDKRNHNQSLLFSCNNVEDSGYSSNVFDSSECCEHLSSINITPVCNANFSHGLSNFKSFKTFQVSPEEVKAFPSPSCQNYAVTLSHGKTGKRENESEDFKTCSNFSPKKLRTDSDLESSSANENAAKDFLKLGSSECKIFSSTPYVDFISKLQSSKNSVYKSNVKGKSPVDFLYLLGIEQCHSPVLRHIFSYLSTIDVYNASRVSKSWNNIILNDPTLKNKIQNFRRMKENESYSSSKLDQNFQGQLLNRVNLMEIQNRIGNSLSVVSPTKNNSGSKSPPVSPSRVRFHLFQKEGQKLDPGESLIQCPRCSLPSRQNKSNNVGLCTRHGCQYLFCLSCYCEFRRPHSCSLITPKIGNKSTITIGSKASRKFLRRL